jgi:hypothetical protein
MKLYVDAYLSQYTPAGIRKLELKLIRPIPLNTLLQEQKIPIDEVHLKVVNQEVTHDLERLISDDDEVKLYRAIGGG